MLCITIITTSSDLQPSTAIANQLPGQLAYTQITTRWPNCFEFIIALVYASFPIWARSLGEYTLFFSPFRDLGQIDFSTSEFAAAIADEGIILAKDPLGSGRGPFCLK